MTARTTSAAGRAAITAREGLRLNAYRDSAGIWTIGVGHAATAPTPPVVREGMTITREQADQILTADLAEFEAAVNAATIRGVTQNQFDAMVSLAFNIGRGAFAKSTVARKVAEGDIQAAADAFLMWDRAGGVVVPGLQTRRKAEREQFLTSDVQVTAATEVAADGSVSHRLTPTIAGPHLLPKPAPRTGLLGWWDRVTGKA